MARTTLRILAREAKVSAATVSLALRGSRQVSESTVRKIRALAEERGYRPDPQVAKLMQHLRGSAVGTRANVAALVERWTHAGPQGHNYLHDLLAGIRSSVESLGYSLDVVGTSELPTSRQLNRVLAGRGIEGLFLLPMMQPSDLTQRLDWARYSVVSVTSSVIAPRFHQVTPNHYDNMVLACQRLKEDGYARIGLAMSQEWDLRVNHRWAGGAAWYNAYVASQPVAPLLQTRPGPELSVDAFVEWVQREKPDAVVLESLDSRVVEAAMARIRRRDKPAIVTMNWPNAWADCGIDQRPKRIGIAAGEALAGMMSRGERGVPEGPLTTMVDGSWCWREAPKSRSR